MYLLIVGVWTILNSYFSLNLLFSGYIFNQWYILHIFIFLKGLYCGSRLCSRWGPEISSSRWQSRTRQWREGSQVPRHPQCTGEADCMESLPCFQGKMLWKLYRALHSKFILNTRHYWAREKVSWGRNCICELMCVCRQFRGSDVIFLYVFFPY